MDTELDSIQGTWDIVQLEVNGTQMDAEAFAGSRIIVDGDAFVTEAMGAAYSGTVRLDSATRPKAIDLHFTAGVEQGNLNRGIYERNGDEWTICLNTTGGGRPTAFATSADSGFALETLRGQIQARNEIPLLHPFRSRTVGRKRRRRQTL